MPKQYSLEPTRENTIGHFSAERKPILAIESGDTVRYRLLDAGWNLEPFATIDAPRNQLGPRHETDDNGHCLVGPVVISGAKAGMTLEIQIGTIRTGTFGFTFAGGWDHPVNKRLGLIEQGILHTWTLDPDKGIGVNQHGHQVTLSPFLGVMGMPPEATGKFVTPPPRWCGGNLDCKELTSGTILYLPIAVDGAYFYTGDGHARQGDGEVSVTAIECPIDQAELTFIVRDDMPLKSPRAKTPTGWITFGLHEDLEEAMYLALEDMLVLMMEQYQLAKNDALALASVVVDLRVTQIVNGVRGVHAFLADDAIQKAM